MQTDDQTTETLSHDRPIDSEASGGLVLHAFIIGMMAGVMTVIFRVIVAQIESFHELIPRTPLLLFLTTLLFAGGGAICGGLAAFLTERFCPEAAGSGIPAVKEFLSHLGPMRWIRILIVKFTGGALALAAGFSLGREGPSVQIGASLGYAYGELRRFSPSVRKQFVVCGAAAGLAAAFNAPLAALMFAIEELEIALSPKIFGSLFVAALCGDVVTRLMLGQNTDFHVHTQSSPSLQVIPIFILIGLAGGALGSLFSATLLNTMRQTAKLKMSTWQKGAAIGFLAGASSVMLPEIVGGGHELVEQALGGTFSDSHVLGLAIALLILKFIFTLLSYCTGVPGGIFAPIVVLGSLLGVIIGAPFEHFWPVAAGSEASFVGAGAVALFTSVVRGPLTGIVLILELTGNYNQLFMISISCVASFLLAERLGQRPIYEALQQLSEEASKLQKISKTVGE